MKKILLMAFVASFSAILTIPSLLFGANQTPTVNIPITDGTLPFQVVVEQDTLTLPSGVHSYVSAMYKGKILILAGRTNGMHDFGNNNNNFPPSSQNTTVFVVDTIEGIVYTKSLTDPSSGLSQRQIDTLSVTSPQSFQVKNTLYISGGYGVDTETGLFNTKPVLTAIDITGLIHWVVSSAAGETAAQHIRQTINSVFQVTGGVMAQPVNSDTTLLMLGQNFQGFYVPDSNGVYTKQVRRFKIHDNGKDLSVRVKGPYPESPNPDYRRRDLNIVPVIHHLYGTPLQAYIAFSGVFTETGGAWTVPILIDFWGKGTMQDPADPSTFKQGMNNYACPTLGIYSKISKTMFVTFFGGISYGFFENGVFTTDDELPFINQITTVSLDKKGNYTQYLMENEYPVILSTGSNPGNPLLFGAGARFFPIDDLERYENDVINLEKLATGPKHVGYIVGGIMSTLPNTNTSTDSAASPYIFRVLIQRND